ncbi:MAG: LacI family DNA-binding transcriptional regulator [Rubrobacteraceae bacterium]
MREVAAEVGVSVATASNAYNRPDQLSEELRVRILEAAKRLGYSGPDPLGRSLRTRRAGAIGVLYTDRLSYAFTDPAAVMFLEGVSLAAEEAELRLFLVPSGPRSGRETDVVLSAAVDGFVVYCVSADDPLIGAAIERGLPMILVDDPSRESVASIGIDDEGGARAAAEHLVELGHRRFGVVSFKLTLEPDRGLADLARQESASNEDTRSRLRGYKTAVEGVGVPWKDVPLYECPKNTPEEGKAAAKALLARDPRPSAILALSDQLAFGVIEAAKELGLSIPEDLSVVGFDDVSEAARSTPPLTTVYQPHVEKGLKAGRKLVALLEGEDPGEPEVLPTRLVIRGSTASP